MRRILHILMPMMAMLLWSCNHKDLCYVHPHNTRLTIVYDWSEAPEATPAGMCAFFYSLDREGDYRRFDFPGAKGGEIELPAGRYVLITYNNDTELVQFSSQQSFADHKAYTRTGDILEPMYGNGVTSTVKATDGERVVITPDALYGCTATDIEISEHGVSYTIVHDTRAGGGEVSTDADSNQTITLRPHDMLCHYSYEVRNVKNAKYISNISGALSGMAGTMNLSDESLDTEPVTLPVPGKANAASNTVTGSFLTFGHNTSNTEAHKMSFYVVMSDGSKYSIKDSPNLDVTSQVHSAPDRRHVHIIIDGLDVPTPMADDSGFKPSVEDWGTINEDIKI